MLICFTLHVIGNPIEEGGKNKNKTKPEAVMTGKKVPDLININYNPADTRNSTTLRQDECKGMHIITKFLKQ
jgi:hypothetical protein